MIQVDWRKPAYSGRPDIHCPDFSSWVDQRAPSKERGWRSHAVRTRFHRNGFDWDMRGTLFEPKSGPASRTSFVLLHGGAGSEMEFVETPDGRPGLAAVLANEGYRALSLSFPGHLPASGHWTESVADRKPCYLLDDEISDAEVAKRNLACTYNTIVQGAALLAERHLEGDDIILFGHSTGGPMSVSLGAALIKCRAAGVVGWGSGGPDGWYREWTATYRYKGEQDKAIGSMARRSAQSFRGAGYDDEADLTPWGRADEYIEWGDRYKAQFKTCLCDNQHGGSVERLLQYEAVTELPRLELVDHLFDPDPAYLARLSVLLLVGTSDRNHWSSAETNESTLECWMARKFAARTQRTSLIVVPRFGHFGFVGRSNELIAKSWVDALENGFFDP